MFISRIAFPLVITILILILICVDDTKLQKFFITLCRLREDNVIEIKRKCLKFVEIANLN